MRTSPKLHISTERLQYSKLHEFVHHFQLFHQPLLLRVKNVRCWPVPIQCDIMSLITANLKISYFDKEIQCHCFGLLLSCSTKTSSCYKSAVTFHTSDVKLPAVRTPKILPDVCCRQRKFGCEQTEDQIFFRHCSLSCCAFPVRALIHKAKVVQNREMNCLTVC